MWDKEGEQVHLGTALRNSLAGLMICHKSHYSIFFLSHLRDKSFALLHKHHLAKEASKKNTTFVVCCLFISLSLAVLKVNSFFSDGGWWRKKY